MKTLKLLLCAVAVSAICSSCSHQVYSVESMYNNYNSRMKSDEELAIKGKVHVYFNEKDIKSDYDIISVNAYKPFVIFQSSLVKKMNKKFLAEAVKKAYEEGGNAILVKSAGAFFVLNLTNWNADDAPAATFKNPIFDTKYSDLVKSGKLATMKRGERVRTEKAFTDEIEANIENVKTLDEVKAVRDKVVVLSNYNLTLKHSKKSIEKAVKKYNKKLNRAEKKIKKAIAKANSTPKK